MVQKKVPNKLGIQAEHVKSEKLLGNLKKQTSCQLQDGKNRGAGMKKQMKRSRSINLSDIESLESTPFKKPMLQPGKPPPLSSSTTPASAPAALQRQPMIRTTYASPNYMKSTTSSEARKERSPVSSSASHVGSDRKNSRSRNSSSKIGSSSGNKPVRSLTKSSSLKLVRTLIKSPSFKPARGTSKKCSSVALCEADVDVQRATCSSTLKGSKFPEYLMLDPGGTEAQGTSVMKVCSYTYCSLNGHHHSPVPPLKCFVKAKRRSLKALKNVKLEGLSPRKSKLFDDGADEIDRQLVDSSVDKKLPNEATKSAEFIKVPLIHEIGVDFFVEIYANEAENGMEGTENGEYSEPEEPDQSTCCDSDAATLEPDDEKQVVDEECSNMQSEVDCKESCEDRDNDLVDVDRIEEFLAKQHQEENSDAEESPILPEQESTIGSFHDGNDIEGECHVSLRDFDNFSEVTDIEWEEDRSSASEDDKEELLSDIKKLASLETNEKSVPDDMVTNCSEEILVDEVLKELFEEEIAFFNTECCDNDLETSLGKGNKVAEKTNLEAENGWGETNLLLEDAENDCSINLSTEALSDNRENRHLQADQATVCLHDRISESSKENIVTEHTVETDGDFNNNQQFEESVCKLDDTDECGHSLQNLANDPLKKEHDKANKVIISTPKDFEDQSDSIVFLNSSDGNNTAEVANMEEEVFTKSDAAETFLTTSNGTEDKSKVTFRYSRRKISPESPESCNNRRWTIGCMKPLIKDLEQERKFNPKEPNFLPVIPDPDAEKVDLKHQMIDERKNSKEWMLDHALQQAVSKLGPARKRKVALLVEAFETVLPTPKWETQTRRASDSFSHTRPIQACS